MTTALAKSPAPSTLRTAAGEPPLGYNGMVFRRDHGEAFEPQESYQAAGWIGVLELESGKWLAQPPGFRIDETQFSSRDAALRTAIARMIRKARRFARIGEGEGTHWSEGFAGRVIEWALSLKPVGEGLVQSHSEQAAAPIVHPASEIAAADDGETVIALGSSEHAGGLNQTLPTDPVIRALCEANRARTTYPAGHTFAMTNPVINGQMVTLGTCTCGETFSYAYGSAGHERMDAAIELHRQKFDHLPEKVNGMGFPIDADGHVIEAKKVRKKKNISSDGRRDEAHPAGPSAMAPRCSEPQEDAPSEQQPRAGVASRPSEANHQPGAGGPPPAPLASAPSADDTPGADAVTIQPAQICASSDDVPTSDPFWDSPLIRAAVDLAWREPPRVTEVQAALLDFGKVYAVGAKPERPVLRWHGGKWLLAPWIISHFPPHRVYVEPFGGAGSVLIRKPRAYCEVWNDLDAAVVNLFQVLRSPRAYELVGRLRLTPFARSEFEETSGPQPDDPVERARHLVIRAFMGFGSNAHNRPSGFRANSNRSGTTPAHDWANYPDSLAAVIERLTGIVVENRDATRVMEAHDSTETLHYIDPPYVAGTRSDDLADYSHEMDDAAHAALLAFLPTLKGMAVLSGYPHPMYDTALPEWRRIEREALADGARPRTEVLWINPACAAALDQQHPALFDIAALDAANTPPLGRDGD